MNLIPLNKRVIVKRTEKETTSAGGIVMLESAQDTPTTGIIVAYDPTTELLIAPGMIVIFGKYAGAEFKVEGETYLILKDEELIALVDESES